MKPSRGWWRALPVIAAVAMAPSAHALKLEGFTINQVIIGNQYPAIHVKFDHTADNWTVVTDDTVEVRIGTERYAARELSLAKEPAVSAILVRSREEALAAYPRMQLGLLLIELAVIAAAAAVALWLPRVLVRREGQRAPDAPRQRL